MGAARLLVSFELLREVLHLPCDTQIRSVNQGDISDSAEFVVLHPDIPDVTLRNDELLPTVCPVFRKQDPVVFEGWGS